MGQGRASAQYPSHPIRDVCGTDPTRKVAPLTEETLGAAGRAALAACREALEPQALAHRAALVEGYVLGCDVLARLQAEHERLGWPVLIEGARGHVTGHPILGELRRQAAHLTELAKALGVVSPAPRSMVGKNLRAPDRVARLRSVKG